MNKNSDLYITYPEGLKKSNEDLYNIVLAHIEHLDLMIQRLYGQKTNIIRKETDFDQQTYAESLDRSSLVVLFIHSSFVDDESYNEELGKIPSWLKQGKNDPPDQPAVFKVCLDPLAQPLEIDSIEQLLPYNFFTHNIFNRKPKSLDFDEETGDPTVYFKLLDLACDIVSSLKTLENIKYQDDVLEVVFLGYSTFDQQEALEEIRRELQDLGYRVLPEVNMPNTAEKFEEMIIGNLQRVKAAIQLMGVQYGNIMKGTKYSLIDFQNRIISEFQKKNPEKNLMRYIWIPISSKITDQRQVLYLKRLKRDEAGPNTEIIESPIETFKTIMTNRLENINYSDSTEYENSRKVYLLSEKKMSEKTDILSSALTSYGLRVYSLDYEEQSGIYTRHLHLLRHCDSVIIYPQNENRFWLNSKLRDLVKALGIGRHSPFRKVILLTSEQPDEELIKIIHTRVEIIRDEQVEPEIVLQKLIDE